MRVLRNILLMSVVMATAVCSVRAAETATEESAAEVGLFDAIDQGLVEVKMTQNGALEGNLSVKNVSDQPLKIDMPAAFAGVPIGQFGMGGPMGGMGGPMGGMGAMPGMGAGGPGGGMGGMGGMPGMGGGRNNNRIGMGGDRRSSFGSSSSGGNQSVGGSSGRSGGRGGRGGWFVAPEKTVREKVRTVCLEYGKKDPRAGQEYSLVPLETVSGNKTTRALCEMLGDDSLDQQAIQAAVWNQESEVPMEELAAKVRRPAGNVTPSPWFSQEEMEGSLELIKAAEVRAEEIAAEEAAEEKAKDIKEEAEILSNDAYDGAPQADTAIEKMTEELK